MAWRASTERIGRAIRGRHGHGSTSPRGRSLRIPIVGERRVVGSRTSGPLGFSISKPHRLRRTTRVRATLARGRRPRYPFGTATGNVKFGKYTRPGRADRKYAPIDKSRPPRTRIRHPRLPKLGSSRARRSTQSPVNRTYGRFTGKDTRGFAVTHPPSAILQPPQTGFPISTARRLSWNLSILYRAIEWCFYAGLR